MQNQYTDLVYRLLITRWFLNERFGLIVYRPNAMNVSNQSGMTWKIILN